MKSKKEKEISKLLRVLTELKSRKANYYSNLKILHEFIETIVQIDQLGKKKKLKVKTNDIEVETIDILLKDWFSQFPDKVIDHAKRDYLVEVIKEIKNTTIYEDWYQYILCLCEWLRLSNSKNPFAGDLAIFLLGYVWRENNETSE